MPFPRRVVSVRSSIAAVGLVALAGLLPSSAVAGTEPLPATAGAATPRTPSAGGIGDGYWPLDGNRGIDVVHYDIDDTYDFASGRLEGSTKLTVRATESLSDFQLDFLLPVTSVLVDGVPARFSRPDLHELRITPAVSLTDGARFTVMVEYAGEPGSLAYAGERNWAADAREVVTMNEPHMAPWWFPSNDHPTDKARFDITITGPATHRAVANGLLVDRSVDGDRATTHWRARDPMAPYLAFFALGRYQVETGVENGLPWYVAVSQELPADEQRASMRSLERSPAVTAWLSNRLGAYPFESTGGLATSLDLYFALENQTRPTYANGSAQSLPTIVHELAHQWFGDSVSVRRWRDIWLNEGFATFMESAYAEKHGGASAQSTLLRTYAATRHDDSFWLLDLTDPGPSHIFDNAVYVRGGMALQALRHRIGERAFWSTMRSWVSDRRYGNGSVGAFRQLAEQTSDENLARFFRTWLSAPRPPAPTEANGLR
ncbi:MAG: M1 family metallopeptidase [Nocardioides sp.]